MLVFDEAGSVCNTRMLEIVDQSVFELWRALTLNAGEVGVHSTTTSVLFAVLSRSCEFVLPCDASPIVYCADLYDCVEQVPRSSHSNLITYRSWSLCIQT